MADCFSALLFPLILPQQSTKEKVGLQLPTEDGPTTTDGPITKLATQGGTEPLDFYTFPCGSQDAASTRAILATELAMVEIVTELAMVEIVEEADVNEIFPSFILVERDERIINLEREELAFHALVGQEVVETMSVNAMGDGLIVLAIIIVGISSHYPSGSQEMETRGVVVAIGVARRVHRSPDGIDAMDLPCQTVGESSSTLLVVCVLHRIGLSSAISMPKNKAEKDTIRLRLRLKAIHNLLQGVGGKAVVAIDKTDALLTTYRLDTLTEIRGRIIDGHKDANLAAHGGNGARNDY